MTTNAIREFAIRAHGDQEYANTPRKPRRFQCAVCKRGPADNVSVYRVTVAREFRCWNCLTPEERARCIR